MEHCSPGALLDIEKKLTGKLSGVFTLEQISLLKELIDLEIKKYASESARELAGLDG